MGVDGLYKFINKNFPEIFNNISISDIKGKSCIIDGMQHIYSQLIYMRSKQKEILTKDGKNISHIHGLINSLTYYLKNEIIPIFIFDGKTPEIKKKKIKKRKKNLKDNLTKLKDLQEQKDNLNNYLNLYSNDINFNNIDNDNGIIFGTPPIDTINFEEEIIKMNNIQEEYKKIYKKTIVMKDYFIKDWIQILELLGLPVIKANGEADPLCAYLLKKNNHIYGIISDDSDMLVFGSPRLMRKSINQQFTIIELDKILSKIEFILSKDFNKKIIFSHDNLVDFSILLGTDYGTFKLNDVFSDSMEILKYYVSNDKNYKSIISSDQYEKFEIIKNYYKDENFISEECSDYLDKPKWNKPKFMELKKRLLDLNVDEDYIDNNNEFLDQCYNKIEKNKNKFNFNNINNINNNSDNYNSNYNSNYNFNYNSNYNSNYNNNYEQFSDFYNNYNTNYNTGYNFRKHRSNSFDNKKTINYNKSTYFYDSKFKKIIKNQSSYSDKYIYKKSNSFFEPNNLTINLTNNLTINLTNNSNNESTNNSNNESTNNSNNESTNNSNNESTNNSNNESTNNSDCDLDNNLDNDSDNDLDFVSNNDVYKFDSKKKNKFNTEIIQERESISSNKSDNCDEIFYFEN